MTFNRIKPEAGRASGKRLPACRYCGQPVPRGRRTFCSEACVDAWKLRTQPPYVRERVMERDHEVCRRCGLDCREVARAVEELRGPARRTWETPVDYRSNETRRLIAQFLRDNGLHRHFWEAHHVVAVIEGGGECGLDGYETLCCGCHARETRELGRRRAGKRGDGAGGCAGA